MTARKCLPWPNKILRTPAETVPEITDEIRGIWEDMIDTMEIMPGIGLAAPQIGMVCVWPWRMQVASVECRSAWPTRRSCTPRSR